MAETGCCWQAVPDTRHDEIGMTATSGGTNSRANADKSAPISWYDSVDVVVEDVMVLVMLRRRGTQPATRISSHRFTATRVLSLLIIPQPDICKYLDLPTTVTSAV